MVFDFFRGAVAFFLLESESLEPVQRANALVRQPMDVELGKLGGLTSSMIDERRRILLLDLRNPLPASV